MLSGFKPLFLYGYLSCQQEQKKRNDQILTVFNLNDKRYLLILPLIVAGWQCKLLLFISMVKDVSHTIYLSLTLLKNGY